ncbi:MAG: PEP-CTERM sorting domain-containing protein [Isosphaeraceae bacterium]
MDQSEATARRAASPVAIPQDADARPGMEFPDMHRMCHLVVNRSRVRTVPAAAAGLILVALFVPAARGDLIRPDASQAFPDMSGDIVGTQNYVYDSNTQTGLFRVSNAPSLLAVGPEASSEFFVTDTPDTVRRQTLQVKLDPSGNLLSDPSNSYALYGSVTVQGRTYSGLLLEGTPTGFGYARQNPQAPTMSVFDVNMKLSGGLLKDFYGPDAYLRVITEANSTFDGTFNRSFQGLKAMTNVRGYNAPSPVAVPENSTFMVVLAFGGAGVLYRRRRRAFTPRELTRPA